MRRKRIGAAVTSALVMLCVVATASAQERERPSYDRRYVSPSGMRYVLTGTARRATLFAFCERAPGAAAVGPDTLRFTDSGQELPVVRDPADLLIANGSAPLRPAGVVVPDRLDGFLLFEELPFFGYGKSVTWVDGTGEVSFSLTLDDIFGGWPKGAEPAGMHDLAWCRDHWIDEGAGSIVLVTLGDEVCEIAVVDGQVTMSGPRRVLALARAASGEHRANALHALSRREPAELSQVAPEVEVAFFGEANPIELRLRAGALLARAGVSRLHDPIAKLFTVARAEGQPEDARRYAVWHLVDVLGDDAVPLLRELLRGEDRFLRQVCYGGFLQCGARALPTLIETLRETEESLGYRSGAAQALYGVVSDLTPEERALARLDSPATLEALFHAVATAERSVAESAHNVLYAVRPEDLRERFIELLGKGTTIDGRLAYFLWDCPTRTALPAIEAALERPQDEQARKWLRGAKERCAKAPGGDG